jgi:predicted nuclease of restriction endonuclease-like (RecB) superfamily
MGELPMSLLVINLNSARYYAQLCFYHIDLNRVIIFLEC